ncbi:molybdopterin molybdotransferase MoeA [Amorphus orientalis]|uniref:Molybdopterin molybdenumtransferase n=1 Tax=Amorphus orientalis TaxID=649198 RepID=A0AAE3VP44_9HYPH|nr:gephyrin-like molybdotransferase Glp [Amorphus orientalis]MDQ0315560.1 molybdopterin molybdotransferase [Amorphus orientalis]
MSLLPVAHARARVLDGADRLGIETVSLADAGGRVLAADLAATRSQPPFPASAMDGYAVRADDARVAGARLRVAGVSAAGRRYPGTLAPGEAVRIFTGAPVPEGAETILIQENAERIDEETVEVAVPVEPGRHIRAAGLDFEEGQPLLTAGTRLGVRHIALAAAMNHPELPVARRPRVALIATGDELVPPGAVPGPDQIVASNTPALAAMIAAAGGEPLDLGIVPDAREATADALARARASGADVIVTLGGASVGEHDLVKQAFGDVGMELGFWKIAMRPGKPLIFGRLSDLRVLGLPGNPVSSLVCALLFLTPLLRALQGDTDPGPWFEPAVLASDMPANGDREDYVRARVAESPTGPPLVEPFSVQDSSMLSTLAVAKALLVRPAHAPDARAGETCRIIRL